jgi:hypothetical protein
MRMIRTAHTQVSDPHQTPQIVQPGPDVVIPGRAGTSNSDQTVDPGQLYRALSPGMVGPSVANNLPVTNVHIQQPEAVSRGGSTLPGAMHNAAQLFTGGALNDDSELKRDLIYIKLLSNIFHSAMADPCLLPGNPDGVEPHQQGVNLYSSLNTPPSVCLYRSFDEEFSQGFDLYRNL